MGQVQVVLALHDVIGELVTDGEPQAIRLAVVADDVQAGHLRFFTSIFGKRRQREGFAGTYDDAAVALVEPFRLNTGLPRRRLTALDAPFEDFHGVGHRGFVTGLLVHLVAGRGAAQMRQTGAADQHVRRVRVIERRQNAQVFEQLRIVVAAAQAEGFDLLLQSAAGFDGGQGQITHAAGGLHFAHHSAFDHADAAFAVTQFELNQMHVFLLFLQKHRRPLWERACSRKRCISHQ